MKPTGKCIAKKCEDCNFYYPWDMTSKEGLRKTIKKCIFLVIAEEIPQFRASVDGCQEATNETKNRVMKFGRACSGAFEMISENTQKMIEDADS